MTRSRFQMVSSTISRLIGAVRARGNRCDRAVLSLIAMIIVAMFAVLTVSSASHAEGKGSRWGANYFPNLKVTSHDGTSYRFYDDLIKGKIVVINFIYTNCPDICGLQTARMSIVQDALGDRLGRDIFIYSISLDPTHDTPKVLKTYAGAFAAKPGWLFLTGEADELHQIRYKLGERSRSLAEHRNDAVLGNDKTGEWGRTSIMSNIELLVQNIFEMDPATRTNGQAAGRLKAPATFKLEKLAGQALFLKACAACHTIGMGDNIGPDLEGVLVRRPHDWVTNYLMFPDRMRKQNDPIAASLSKKFKGVVMPNLSLSRNDAADLIAYIRGETKRLSASGHAPNSHAGHRHHH